MSQVDRVALSLVALLTSIVLSSCISITTVDPRGREVRRTRTEFRAYAEEVFRRQNRAGGELMFVPDDLPDTDPVLDAALASAESAMLADCEFLNRLAVARRDGQPIRAGRRREFPDSVAACDRSTARLEVLLEGL